MSYTTPVSAVSPRLRSGRWPRQACRARSSRVLCVSCVSACSATSRAQFRAQIWVLTCADRAWLWARIEPPGPNAAAQLTREHGWTRLVVTSLIVDRGHWRGGAGTALLEKAEAWGRARGAQVARLDTYAYSPVSVPFYEDHMGYQRRSIVFQKRL
jgi:GNAT superfamily N-acetyltransferase